MKRVIGLLLVLIMTFIPRESINAATKVPAPEVKIKMYSTQDLEFTVTHPNKKAKLYYSINGKVSKDSMTVKNGGTIHYSHKFLENFSVVAYVGNQKSATKTIKYDEINIDSLSSTKLPKVTDEELKAVKEIVDKVTADETEDYMKLYRVFNWLRYNIDYDDGIYLPDVYVKPHSKTITSLIMDKIAYEKEFARFMQTACNILKIENKTAILTYGIANIVKIDGKWYYIKPAGKKVDANGYIDYDDFLNNSNPSRRFETITSTLYKKDGKYIIDGKKYNFTSQRFVVVAPDIFGKSKEFSVFKYMQYEEKGITEYGTVKLNENDKFEYVPAPKAKD